MTSEGLGEMFEGDSADTCAGKFPLGLMGGRAEGLVCADPGARTYIGASGNCLLQPLCCYMIFGHISPPLSRFDKFHLDVRIYNHF